MALSISNDEIKRVNRLELLLFSLGNRQSFGINVLKVKELMPCPELTQLPGSQYCISGVAHLRGHALSVIDLAKAIGLRPLGETEKNLVITEFNRVSHGFVVDKIEKITVIDWSEVKPPSAGLGNRSYITGVANVNNRMVQILDVEKVLDELGIYQIGDVEHLTDVDIRRDVPILIVDDSVIALKQTKRTLDQLQVPFITAKDGKDALELLKRLASEHDDITDKVSMVISDIEMPEMDGYTLTQEIRNDNRLRGLYILLHSSLNGIMNDTLAQKVGADSALTKFVPDDLAKEVIRGLAHK